MTRAIRLCAHALTVVVLAACSDVAADDDPSSTPATDAPAGADGGLPVGDGGVTCGTATGEPCAPGARCVSDDDCEGLCTSDVCAVPTHDDGKRSASLGETDVDCGGPTAPKCDEARGCAIDDDCTTSVCGAGGTCVSAPSCRGALGAAGVATCGAGEVGQAGAAHESCCRSLPLPNRTDRLLDRYEITAGRLRAFVEAVTAANGGVPNIRAFAKQYAAAHPGSQLADVVSGYPGLLDVLPDRAGSAGPFPLPVHLGAFPLDPINVRDGCYVGDGQYGHNAYWQEPADLKPYGIGIVDAGGPTGRRVYPREVLDEKAVACVMPLMLASFCAWDGGELARTADYHAVWGDRAVSVGAASVKIPWKALLPIGQFNWRNGHATSCGALGAWPGCQNPQTPFYAFPSGGNPANDDTPAMGAPGRFVADVTETTSAGGSGWFDIGGNLMEAAWPVGTIPRPTRDVCDQSASPGPGETACSRGTGRNGVRRYTGQLPHIALVGYSFEGHARRAEAYLSSASGDESLIASGDAKPVTFQYGKVGGRCARPAR